MSSQGDILLTLREDLAITSCCLMRETVSQEMIPIHNDDSGEDKATLQMMNIRSQDSRHEII